jgi:hypothetical protein
MSRAKPASVARLVVFRWMWVAFLAAIASLLFEILLPTGWQLARQIVVPDTVPPFALLSLTTLGIFVLLVIVLEPLRFRFGQLRFAHLHPPLWVAIAVGLGAVLMRFSAALDFDPAAIKSPASVPVWIVVLTAVLAGLALSLRARSADSTPTIEPAPTDSAEVSALSWDQLADWAATEKPSGPAEPDLFRHRRTAHRIARILTDAEHGEQTIALVGEYGSGKSTVLNWTERELYITQPNAPIWVCRVSCWGFQDSVTAAAHVLERLVETVERHLDVIPIRGLSSTYRRVLTADALVPLSWLFGSEQEVDALNRLDDLGAILRTVRARVVLFIEDADRGAGAGFEPGHVERLLWRLRDVQGLTFVLAVDEKRSPYDLTKLCDHIELLPAVDQDDVARMIVLLREHCRSDFTVRAPSPGDGTKDPLDLDVAQPRMLAYMRERFSGSPRVAIARLLVTPRRIKHVIRRVDRAWRALAGEVDLNDLIVMSALREGAPDVFRFLVANIDSARNQSDEFDKRPDEVKRKWESLLAESDQARIAKPLADALGIRQISSAVATRKQSVQHDEPHDYFRRILEQEVDPADVRDQVVLKDIGEWLEGHASPMVDKLFDGTDQDEGYVRVWEYCAAEIPNPRVSDLVDTIVRRLVDRRDPRVRPPVLASLWRENNRRHDKEVLSTARLVSLIRHALSSNLALANDLYYFWTSTRYGPYVNDNRIEVRQGVASAARDIYADPRLLIGALRADDESFLFSIRGLVLPEDQDEPPSALREFTDWAWMAQPLIEAVAAAPEAVLPQLVRLVGEARSSPRLRPVGMMREYRLDFARLDALFGVDAETVVRQLANVESSGDWAVLEAVAQCRERLRRS